VLLIEGDCALDRGVGDGVAVGEVLGDDAGAGFVLLRDLDVVLVGGFGGDVAGGDLVDGLGGGDGDLGRAELGVVEEEGGFGGGFFLEGYGCGLGGCGGGDGEGGDFATGRR
jgi:hypothetical protein